MARLPYIDTDQLPAPYRQSFRSHINITRVLANSPAVMQLSGTVARYIRETSQFDPRLREMAIIQVGYSTNSIYEYTHHIEIGLKSGVTADDVHAIADETAGKPTTLEPLAKLVLRAAREITQDIAVTDATFAELQRHLANERIVDLLFAIANYNSVVRMLASLKVDLEDEYRTYLDQFPLRS